MKTRSFQVSPTQCLSKCRMTSHSDNFPPKSTAAFTRILSTLGNVVNVG